MGLHQGFVLSALLFIGVLVLEALSREFKEGLPMELFYADGFYADDIVLMAETGELLLKKLRRWNIGMVTNPSSLVRILSGGQYTTRLRSLHLPEPSSFQGSTLGTRAAEHKGGNWGMQVD